MKDKRCIWTFVLFAENSKAILKCTNSKGRRREGTSATIIKLFSSPNFIYFSGYFAFIQI